jgi:hypothetical protein
MTNTITDKQILELWRSPLFVGSYSGVKTFQACLKLEKNISISEKKLYQVLKQDPVFLIHQKGATKIQRRHLVLNNYGEVVFGDIAYMYPYNDYKYFVLVVDGFSGKIFVRPLKSKNSAIVALALDSIFEEFGSQVYVFETDQGGEFKGESKTLFKRRNIIYKLKYGKNKSFMSENYIKIVKRRLYQTLRGTLNQDWVTVLETVVDNLNNIPTKRIGYLKPNSIRGEFDSVKVQEAKKTHNIKTFTEDSWKKQKQNQEEFEKSSALLKVNDYCYIDFDEKLFDKSYDVKVNSFIFSLLKLFELLHKIYNTSTSYW